MSVATPRGGRADVEASMPRLAFGSLRHASTSMSRTPAPLSSSCLNTAASEINVSLRSLVGVASRGQKNESFFPSNWRPWPARAINTVSARLVLSRTALSLARTLSRVGIRPASRLPSVPVSRATS